MCWLYHPHTTLNTHQVLVCQDDGYQGRGSEGFGLLSVIRNGFNVQAGVWVFSVDEKADKRFSAF
jgi:hypothetical protein